MISLAIESTTECCSIALQSGDSVLERCIIEPQGHARYILPWAGELLAEASLGFSQIDRLVVSRGPGGFTSLRIGLGIVQGLALAHDLPVHPVSSLEVLAQSGDPDRHHPQLLALFDARMGEVYAAWYEQADGRRVRLGAEQLCSPEDLRCPDDRHWHALGPGVTTFRETLDKTFGQSVSLAGSEDETTWPRALALLALADQVEPVAGHEMTPTYLRDQVTG